MQAESTDGEKGCLNASSSFRLSSLGRLEEQHLLLHDGVVLEHAEGTVCTRPDQGAVVAGHGHGDQPDRDRARLRCRESLC